MARNEELWNGNRERWANLMSLNPKRVGDRLVDHEARHYRRQYGEIFESGTHGSAAVVRLRSAAAVREFLQRYAEPPGPPTD